MAEPLADQIVRQTGQAVALYHRLLLVVAPAGAGKTATLHDAGDRTGAPVVNLNLQLSQRMLELSARERPLRLPHLLREIVDDGTGEMILLDNIEIIFDVGLKKDPLRLLQGISRNKTVVAAWNGAAGGDYLTYAAPGHPEHRRYPMNDLQVVSPGAPA